MEKLSGEQKEVCINGIDDEIYNYIKNNEPESYDQVLKDDARWEVFYHLNPMRESLFNWFDFKENTNLLEIGGGFGALTKLFCQRCKQVVSLEPNKKRADAIRMRCNQYSNLSVLETKIEDYDTKEKYDYIILVGLLETQGLGKDNKNPYIKFLKTIKKFLKEDGHLILAVENRYGARYFCGEPEPYSGIPFEGLNKFPQGKGKGYLFDRRELCDILEMSGLLNYKFYYPFPDYKIPQLVYSDNYLQGVSIRERLIPYYMNKNALVAAEMDMYLDFLRNGVFPFFANSFLVECSLDDKYCDVNYAAISGDRGKDGSFITAICEGNRVKKIPLYKEGMVSLEQCYKNIKEIEKHGVKVIEHIINENYLEMPYEASPTCTNYLLDVVTTEPQKYEEIFDKLYADIIKASKISEKDCFLDNIYGKKDWGPVLETAYIDMVPVNCFYKNDELYFFDQEFKLNDCPAKFVMYRALKYMYVYAKNAEKYVPLKSMKTRYDITDEMWKIFEEVEKNFIFKNRNMDLYSNFYKWTGVNRRKIAENAKKLLN